MLEAVRRIVTAVTCPVTTDIGAGYGDTIEAKLDTIRQVVAAGAVGINIEDPTMTTGGNGAPGLVDVVAQAELIQAIHSATTAEWDIPLVINARVDVKGCTQRLPVRIQATRR